MKYATGVCPDRGELEREDIEYDGNPESRNVFRFFSFYSILTLCFFVCPARGVALTIGAAESDLAERVKAKCGSDNGSA